MARPWSWPVVTVLAAIAIGTCHLAAQTAPRPQPSFASGVDLVTVDVTVLTRGGEPRTDLRLEDFILTVDGSPRRIVSMRLLKADAAASEAVAAAPAAPVAPSDAAAPGRRFVLVVDREHVGAGEGQAMLAAAAKFVDDLPAEDRSAVWRLPPASGAVRFKADRDEVKAELLRAVGTYRRPPGPWMIARDEAIDILDGKREVLQAVIARECYKQYPGCPGEVEAEARVLGFDWRHRAETTLAGLRDLVDSLGAVEGPKHIVLITGGPVFSREELSSVNVVAARSAAARVTIHALQVAEPPYQASTEHMRPTPMQIDQARSAAYALAGQTGGLAITPSAPEIAFNQLTRELSASYLLTFEPVPAERDGRPHAIAVQVRDAGWGTSVRARKAFTIDPGAPRATAPTASAGTAPTAAPDVDPAGTAPDPPAAVASSLPADLASLTGALARYAEGYGERLSAAVAEERYVQITHPWRGNPKGPEAEPRLAWQEPGTASAQGGPVIARRQLVSDVLLVQVRQGDWMCYRDVAEVDGAPVRNRADRVRSLLLSPSPDRMAQLRRIGDESARYNLGDFRRTLNLPNVALSFMRPADQGRFTFKREKDEVVDGRPARVLSYREKVRPTLVRTQSGVDIPLYGRLWLDPGDGRVLRTELRFDLGGERRSLIRVDFRAEPGLGVLVPARMWEWYEGADQLGRIGGDKTLVQGLATYTSYRRFQVTTTEAPR
jgi:VWFA-related protein